MPITFVVRKFGPVHVAEPDLVAGGRQAADEIQVNLEIFKNHCTSKYSTFALFNQGIASLQQQKCIPYIFQVKSIVKLVF